MKNGALRLTFRIESQHSSVTSSAGTGRLTPAKFGGGRIDGGGEFRRAGRNIHHAGHGAPPRTAHKFGGSLKLLLIAPPARHVRAAFRKRPRNGAPQPAARPRDKGFFPAQPFMSFHAVLLAESAGTGASVCRNENVSPLWMRHIVAFSTSIFRTIIFHKQKQAVI